MLLPSIETGNRQEKGADEDRPRLPSQSFHLVKRSGSPRRATLSIQFSELMSVLRPSGSKQRNESRGEQKNSGPSNRLQSLLLLRVSYRPVGSCLK